MAGKLKELNHKNPKHHAEINRRLGVMRDAIKPKTRQEHSVIERTSVLSHDHDQAMVDHAKGVMNKSEEKFYTPEEVARALLKRTHELITDFKKSNTSHEIENGGEPSNDEAEAPAYLAEADIENSGAHGEKTKKSKAAGAGIESADKDGDGDIDGDDAIEAQEEQSGKDLDGDGEASEAPEHKAKIAAAAKAAPKADDDKDPKATIKAATEEKPASEAKDKKLAFAKSEESDLANKESRPSLKKFMLARKMKKAGVPTADARQGEKMSGATPAPTPAEKIKAQPKLEMEKNKSVEKLMGIAPKAGK